jgi:iron complex outermembrane receptor protein
MIEEKHASQGWSVHQEESPIPSRIRAIFGACVVSITIASASVAHAQPSEPPVVAEPVPGDGTPVPGTPSDDPSSVRPESVQGRDPAASPTVSSPPKPEAKIAPASQEESTATNTPAQLKAVVVTADRREEVAQKVPTSLTVLGGDTLTDTGVGRSAKEVLDQVPSASAITQLHGRPRWWIRGVGTGQQQLDFANPIGFYLDDVYISNASATGFPLFDLDRVEVLRGPQGTLWGKNTTGGAINVISRRPSLTDTDGYIRADYGTYHDQLVEGAGNGVIWKNHIATRTSVHYESREGRFTNLYDGRSAGAFQDAAFRLQLLGKITEDWEAVANLHLRLYTTNGAISTVSGAGANGAYINGYIPSTELNSVNSNAPTSSLTRQNGATLTVKGRVGDLALTAISAFEEYKNIALGDGDNTPLEISRTWSDAVSRQYSQEVRLASPRADRLNWVAGLYGFYENIGSKAATGRLPGSGDVGPANYALQNFTHKNESFAPFASSTFNITDQLSLKGGLRWTWEHRDLDIRRIQNSGTATFSDAVNWWNPTSVSSGLTQIYATHPNKSWTNFTWDVTPTYAITPDHNVYARVAYGVKSGGYNTAATEQSALIVVEPEKLFDYEVGAKTSWLNHRLVVNAAAFYYDYRDVQINVVGPLPPTNTSVSYLQNAQKARNYGGELEVDVLPVKYLHLGGNLGLQDAKFTKFTVVTSGDDYSGNSLVRSPKVSTFLRADVQLPLSSEIDLVAGGDWRFQSKQYHYTTGQNDPLLGNPAFSLVNLRLSLRTSNDKFSLTFYANNALDKRYLSHSGQGVSGAAGATSTWGDPRTVGVNLVSRWW